MQEKFVEIRKSLTQIRNSDEKQRGEVSLAEIGIGTIDRFKEAPGEEEEIGSIIEKGVEEKSIENKQQI